MHDPIGNRDTEGAATPPGTRYTANARNEYTALSNPTGNLCYDPDGNLIQGGKPTSNCATPDGAWTYAWDAENRLTEVVTTRTGGQYQNGDIKLDFTYDYMGRRIRKQASHWDDRGDWHPDADLRFVYDGWNVVMVVDSSGTPQQKYTWGLDLSGLGAVAQASLPANGVHGAGGIGGLLAVEETAAEGSPSYWFFFDGNGNVGQVIRASDQGIPARYEYDPYGNTLVAEGAYAAANPLRFSTKWCDTEPGTGHELYYYGYRYYSPRLGRWLSRDPIGEDGGLNLYAFVLNEPVALYDPTGLVGLSTPTCRQCCGNAYNKCREDGGSIADCDHLLRGCHYACENYGNPGAEAAGLCGGYTPPSQTPWLLCCGTCRRVPVLDYGPAHDVVVIGCTALSFAAPSGATCKVIMADANALRVYRGGAVGCRLVRIRKWIRYDLPHHAKCAEWDGAIPNCLRKCRDMLGLQPL